MPANMHIRNNRSLQFEQLESRRPLAGDFLAYVGPLDVNQDQRVSPLDALMVVNGLNDGGASLDSNLASSIHLDTNGDGKLSVLDALAIVNHLAFATTTPGSGSGGSSAQGHASYSLSSTEVDRVEVFDSVDGGAPITVRVNAPRFDLIGCDASTVVLGWSDDGNGGQVAETIEGSTLRQSTNGRCSYEARPIMGQMETSEDYFRLMIGEAVASNATDVFFPKRRYRFEDAEVANGLKRIYIHIKGSDTNVIQDMVFDFQNSTLEFTEESAFGIKIQGAQRIVLKNARVQWAQSQGTLATLSKHATYYELVADEPIPVVGNELKLRALTSYDRSANTWYTEISRSLANCVAGEGGSETCTGWVPVQESDRIYRVPITQQRSRLENMFGAGETSTDVVLRYSKHGSVAVSIGVGPNDPIETGQPLTEDIAVKNFDFRRIPGLSIGVGVSRGILLQGNTLFPVSGEPVSGASGFINAAPRRDLIVEDNRVSGNGDDALNVQRKFAVAVGAPQTRPDGNYTQRFATRGTGFDYEPGDVATIYDVEMRKVGAAEVVSIDRSPGDCVTLPGEVSPIACFDLVLNSDTAAPQGGYLFNTSQSQGGTIVRNNLFRNFHGRVLVQTKNALIEGNEIAKATGSGIIVGADVPRWLEGPGPSNVTVRENSVFRVAISPIRAGKRAAVNYGGISISAEVPIHDPDAQLPKTLGVSAVEPMIEDILLVNNDVKQTGAAGLLVASATRVTVQNVEVGRTNDLVDASPTWVNGEGPIGINADLNSIADVVVGGASSHIDLSGLTRPANSYNANGISRGSLALMGTAEMVTIPINIAVGSGQFLRWDVIQRINAPSAPASSIGVEVVKAAHSNRRLALVPLEVSGASVVESPRHLMVNTSDSYRLSGPISGLVEDNEGAVWILFRVWNSTLQADSLLAIDRVEAF